jgi:hypothetical protein
MPKLYATIPLPFYAIVIASLIIFQSQLPPIVFEPSVLVAILTTCFVVIALLIVAYISARSYLVSGSIILLLLGAASLMFGSTQFVAVWLGTLPGGLNPFVTVSNAGLLTASALHVSAAVLVMLRNHHVICRTCAPE